MSSNDILYETDFQSKYLKELFEVVIDEAYSTTGADLQVTHTEPPARLTAPKLALTSNKQYLTQ